MARTTGDAEAICLMETALEIWKQYQALERDTKEVIEHIPLVEEHLSVWSLRLGDILIVLGSVIDSVFKFALQYEGLTETMPEVMKKIRAKDRFDMGDYRQAFEDYYGLSSKHVYIRPLAKRIQPFEKWADGSSPDWWEAYQRVKHDKFVNKKDAQLRYVVDGLAGLFLLNVIHIPNRIVLARLKQWQDYWGQNLGERYLENLLREKEPISSSGVLFLETELYGYILESNRREETKQEDTWHRVLALLKEPRY